MADSEETAQDSTLSTLREVVMRVWPDERSDCPATLLAYWNYRDELTVADGLILKGNVSSSLSHYSLLFSSNFTILIKGLRNVGSQQRGLCSGQTLTGTLMS